MCGISAILFTAHHPETQNGLEGQLLESVRLMSHRGPDSEGIFVDEARRIGEDFFFSFITPSC